jgi:hypothetical protein
MTQERKKCNGTVNSIVRFRKGVPFTKCCYGDEIKENEVGETCSMLEGR